MNSCIYNGIVKHQRFKPIEHSLNYKTFSILAERVLRLYRLRDVIVSKVLRRYSCYVFVIFPSTDEIVSNLKAFILLHCLTQKLLGSDQIF